MRDTLVNAASLSRQLNGWRGPDGEPAYRRLAEALKLIILDGRLSLNARLPGERRLAETLGVSRITVSAALDRLRADGFIVSRTGSGSFTALPASPASPPVTYLDGPMQRVDAPGVIDMASAAMAADEQVHAAYARALEALPAHLPGPGYEPIGVEALRRVVADRYSDEGMATTAQQVVVTAGALGGLALLLRAATRPGDRAVVEHPGYPHALDALTQAGLALSPVAMTPQGWDMDGMLAAIARVRPRLIYLIGAHHNPTGHVLSAQDEADIAAAAARVGAMLVLDDSLRELWFDRPPPPPVDHGPHVARLGSTSKPYWGGLRVGWLRAHVEVIDAVVRHRPSLDLGLPVMEQLAAAMLLTGDPTPLHARRRLLARREAHLRTRLTEHLPQWRTRRPDGGLSLWVELPRPDGLRLAIAAPDHGVRIAPGMRFGINGAFDRFIRLPFSREEAELDLAVVGLAAAWGGLDRKTPRRTALDPLLPAVF
ncbi:MULTISPECIES: MocR-like transcription factor YczR [Brevundimonas]|uniref:MocR-like transcription factor YczR n=1 Tax=Brevundimonas TaxID=41275 RepID=UPI0019034332|nr:MULTISPECIES: PLP-dependent aminotransferase family protein [Brevundimonas]MBK1977065.1 PLP-dependent aminotransferase family protein [Brevundimonas diminuta]MDM8354040.1 PLP-dependent aminotransferase family protein [Brevundimonas diminuta]